MHGSLSPSRPVISRPVISLEVPALDRALPWGGLPAGGLHEVLAAAAGGTGDDGAALAFTAFLAGRFQAGARHGGGVVWCRPVRRRQEGGLPCAAGLHAWGLDSRGLVLVEVRREQDLFWVLEEVLRDGSATAVIGETGSGRAGTVPDIALRRLQLAAERSGRPVLLLHPTGGEGRTCPALTRWKVQAWRRPMPREEGPREEGPREEGPREGGAANGEKALLPPSGWRIDLLRCRGGQPRNWTLVSETGSGRARGDRTVARPVLKPLPC